MMILFDISQPSSEVMMWPTWVDYTTNISHLATVFNSSINFYIYLAKHGARQRPPGSQPLLSLRLRVRWLKLIKLLMVDFYLCYRTRAVPVPSITQSRAELTLQSPHSS